VDQNDVDEALRLMEKSQVSVNENDEDELKMKPKTDNISAIFGIIKEACKNHRKECKFSDLEKRVFKKFPIDI
jgi:DNA replicative helicase MCM subunit Mcm2 (Cdc46/Mcm family)